MSMLFCFSCSDSTAGLPKNEGLWNLTSAPGAIVCDDAMAICWWGGCGKLTRAPNQKWPLNKVNWWLNRGDFTN